MNEVELSLPLKHARFVLQAIDFRLETWKKAVESGELGEDDISDINNDSMLLLSVRDELRTKLLDYQQKTLNDKHQRGHL